MKIVICGNYGAKNIGDEMILEGLLKSIKSIDPKAEITVLSADPGETSAKHGVTSVPKFPAGLRSLISYIQSKNNSTKKAVQKCDYFILGGGGLFGSLNFHANIIWAIQAFMAYRLGKRVIMYGQSISPIKWAFIRKIVKKIFQKAFFIAVRDADSRIELEKLGVTRKIEIMPDLAFRSQFIDQNGRTGTLEFPITKPSVSTRRSAIIALRQLSSLGPEFKKNITTFLNWLIEEQNYYIKFMNFQEGKDSDNKLHYEIIEQIKDQTKIQHLQNIHDSTEVLNHFATANFVLGMRLHSIISATKTATPFIAISYSSKIDSYVKDLGLTEYSINLTEINPEKLKKLFNKMQNEKMSLKESLKLYNKDSQKMHLVIEKKLLHNLTSN